MFLNPEGLQDFVDTANAILSVDFTNLLGEFKGPEGKYMFSPDDPFELVNVKLAIANSIFNNGDSYRFF